MPIKNFSLIKQLEKEWKDDNYDILWLITEEEEDQFSKRDKQIFVNGARQMLKVIKESYKYL